MDNKSVAVRKVSAVYAHRKSDVKPSHFPPGWDHHVTHTAAGMEEFHMCQKGRVLASSATADKNSPTYS